MHILIVHTYAFSEFSGADILGRLRANARFGGAVRRRERVQLRSDHLSFPNQCLLGPASGYQWKFIFSSPIIQMHYTYVM